MDKSFSNLMASCDVLRKEDIKDLTECTGYNSMGTLNWVIDMLQILKERIQLGNKIKNELSGEYFTEKSFQEFVYDTFCEYVAKGVFKDKILKGKVYFNIKNSEPGLDLVYTGNVSNKLFKWIADIDDEYCLMQLIPTSVVYIRNNKTKTMTPFLSEKNSCYIYDEKDGKIKEVGI